MYCERQEEASDVELIDELKQEDTSNKKTYNIIDIENFLRGIGIVIIVVFSGYIIYKIIRKNKSNNRYIK